MYSSEPPNALFVLRTKIHPVYLSALMGLYNHYDTYNPEPNLTVKRNGISVELCKLDTRNVYVFYGCAGVRLVGKDVR